MTIWWRHYDVIETIFVKSKKDIKPYIPEYDIPKDDEKAKTAAWLQSANQSSSSIKNVGFTERANKQIEQLCVGDCAFELKEKIVKLVTNDPRSLHRKQCASSEGKNSIFFLNFLEFTITVWFDSDHVEVLKVEPFYEHKKAQEWDIYRWPP